MSSAAQKISKKYGIKIAIAPPQHLIGSTVKFGGLVFAQHLDNANPGSTTGYMVPELIKNEGVKGALINHSEHRMKNSDISALVDRLKKLGITSVVCVRDTLEVKRHVKLNPDYIAIEPPDLIGSGKAVSKERPEMIVKAASIIRAAENNTKLLCGAGLISSYDVMKALELGSKGILVASGVVKANNPGRVIESFAKAML